MLVEELQALEIWSLFLRCPRFRVSMVRLHIASHSAIAPASGLPF